MTLMAHRLIDALRAGSDELLEVPGIKPGYRASLAQYIHDAEKFDFGQLPLEVQHCPDGVSQHSVPKLSSDELEFWHQGLIPLPAPLSYYEFSLGEYRSALLLLYVGGQWLATRIDRATMDGRTRYGLDGMLLEFRPDPEQVGKGVGVSMTGSPLFQNSMTAEERTRYAANAYLGIYLTLMLNSRTTDMQVEAAPPKVNKKRLAAGKAPLYTHRVVDIVPQRFAKSGEGQGGTHASPRLHWRRSHVRRFDHQTSGSKWCPFLQGPDGSMGCFAVVIPRFVVGKAELGEVSHEYRVLPRPKETA